MTRFGNVVRNYLGEGLVAVGAIHSAAAIIEFRSEFAGIVDDRFWATVEVAGSGLRGEALWFTVSGAMLIVTGLLVRSNLRATGSLPMSFSIGFTLVGAAITIAMPDSGAWMALVGGALAVMVSSEAWGADRRAQKRPAPSRASMDLTV